MEKNNKGEGWYGVAARRRAAGIIIAPSTLLRAHKRENAITIRERADGRMLAAQLC